MIRGSCPKCRKILKMWSNLNDWMDLFLPIPTPQTVRKMVAVCESYGKNKIAQWPLIFEFSKKIKKRIFREYSVEYSWEYSFLSANQRLPRGKPGVCHVAPTWRKQGSCVCLKILVERVVNQTPDLLRNIQTTYHCTMGADMQMERRLIFMNCKLRMAGIFGGQPLRASPATIWPRLRNRGLAANRRARIPRITAKPNMWSHADLVGS